MDEITYSSVSNIRSKHTSVKAAYVRKLKHNQAGYKPKQAVAEASRIMASSGLAPLRACRLYRFAMNELACRPDCGACCSAPSISSAIPGMPNGKPAGTRCIQLDDANRCMIFGKPGRPAVCESLQPSAEMCGETREYAMHFLAHLDLLTS